MQQDVILTTLPVAERNWSVWKSEKGVRPPRGYAHAELVLSPAVTASVYAVHLKSNYGSRDAGVRAENRAKRELSARQLVALAMGRTGVRSGTRRSRETHPVVIAGDFNADPSRRDFAGERTVALLVEAAFQNVLELLPPAARVTHPNVRYGGSTLDYIFTAALEPIGPPRILPAGELSDHDPVFTLLKVREL